MAYTTINKSTAHFDTNLYQANGSGKTISNMDFQPDFVWTKNRDSASYIPALVDAVRGGTKKLFSNNTNAESTDTNAITAFNSDGYTFGSSGSFNYGTDDYVNWCWKANGAGSANTDGDQSTTVSANTTSGFSIVKYTGTGTTTNFGHGLGTKPNVILIKSLSSNDWVMNGDFLGSTTWQHKIILNSTAAKATANNFNDQAPTNSVFYLNSGHGTTNGSGTEYIAYCFADVQGYSKVGGSYTGNGNADGPFIYTGFKPAFVLIKNASATASWRLTDNKRFGYNPKNIMLYPNLSNAESTSELTIDYLSNGFKIRATDSGVNGSGNTLIYMAFAEAPLVGTNGVTAKAR